MRIRPQHFEEFHQIAGIVVKAEVALGQRDLPRILPVRDIGIEIAREAADRILQQRGVMPRKRRGDQQLGLDPTIVDREMQQVGKWQAVHDHFLQIHFLVIDVFPHFIARLAVGLELAGGKFADCRHCAHRHAVAQWVGRRARHRLGRVKQSVKRPGAAAHQFICWVNHGVIS